MQSQGVVQPRQTPNIIQGPRRADHKPLSNVVVGRQPRRAGQAVPPVGHGFDLVLSSGFLAFANHAGFLAAAEEVGLPVNAVMGTSAGALTGSLYCAGFSPDAVAGILSSVPPIQRLRPCYMPWEGLLTMEGVIEELAMLMPARFEELKRPLGVGLASTSGRHVLVDSGSLPAAVAASAAIPYVFAPVSVPGLVGGPFMDGGVCCRIGLDLWRSNKYGGGGAVRSKPPPAVVHLISRSSPFSGNDDTSDFGRQNAAVLHSKKANKSFWDLGDFEADYEASRRRALPVLRELMERHAALAELQREREGGQTAGDEDEQHWQQPRPAVVV